MDVIRHDDVLVERHVREVQWHLEPAVLHECAQPRQVNAPAVNVTESLPTTLGADGHEIRGHRAVVERSEANRAAVVQWRHDPSCATTRAYGAGPSRCVESTRRNSARNRGTAPVLGNGRRRRTWCDDGWEEGRIMMRPYAGGTKVHRDAGGTKIHRERRRHEDPPRAPEARRSTATPEARRSTASAGVRYLSPIDRSTGGC